ncbi:HAD family hydrolase [Kitasatospora sp. NPDC059577]|uniref:HAD family hydrolase n=1 Tax=unclassified Kitasatospora TaxID=2633591 RepID=UPI003699C953
MTTRAFDAVLCDVDGVIRFFDGAGVAALERAAGLGEGSTAGVGFAPENDLPLLLGRIGKAEWVESIARGLAGRVSGAQARGLAEAFANSPFWADEVAVGMLRQVREHCRVVLVTNATVWLDEDLERLGLTDLAHEVVNSSVVGSAKPERRIYEIAAERAGVAPERCVFVDDRQENVDAAVALGMTGVLYRGPEDLRRAVAPLLG